MTYEEALETRGDTVVNCPDGVGMLIRYEPDKAGVQLPHNLDVSWYPWNEINIGSEIEFLSKLIGQK